MDREILQAERHNRELTLVMIDIDFFKSFNDQWGHQVGDIVLKRAAETIKINSRSTDYTSRYGGEEISIILPEIGPSEAYKMAEKIRKEIESLSIKGINNSDKITGVTVSLGIAGFPRHAGDKDMLIQKADYALYLSKSRGRNRTTIA